MISFHIEYNLTSDKKNPTLTHVEKDIQILQSKLLLTEFNSKMQLPAGSVESFMCST